MVVTSISRIKIQFQIMVPSFISVFNREFISSDAMLIIAATPFLHTHKQKSRMSYTAQAHSLNFYVYTNHETVVSDPLPTPLPFPFQRDADKSSQWSRYRRMLEAPFLSILRGSNSPVLQH